MTKNNEELQKWWKITKNEKKLQKWKKIIKMTKNEKNDKMTKWQNVLKMTKNYKNDEKKKLKLRNFLKHESFSVFWGFYSFQKNKYKLGRLYSKNMCRVVN
jgi:hypothetical protein